MNVISTPSGFTQEDINPLERGLFGPRNAPDIVLIVKMLYRKILSRTLAGSDSFIYSLYSIGNFVEDRKIIVTIVDMFHLVFACPFGLSPRESPSLHHSILTFSESLESCRL